jgi:DNA-binding MarR family transcriptional regulator
LEQAGIVNRIRDKRDSRKTLVYLTAKGRKLFMRVLPEIHYVNRRALRGLSEFEKNEIKRLLKHMRGNMAKKP